MKINIGNGETTNVIDEFISTEQMLNIYLFKKQNMKY